MQKQDNVEIVSKTDFETNLEERIEDLQEEYLQLSKLKNKYLKDKKKYVLQYYLKDETYYYKQTREKRIGYK